LNQNQGIKTLKFALKQGTADIISLLQEEDSEGECEEENYLNMLKTSDVFDIGVILLECALGGMDIFADSDIPCARGPNSPLNFLDSAHGECLDTHGSP
jgi:hypothetical protein